MEKLKILILGDGLLGGEILKQTGWDFISRKKDNIDVRNFHSFSDMLSSYSIILNCIANTDTYSNNKDLHWDVNFKFVNELVDYCNINNKKLIHISTDYIYTNSSDNTSEEDIPIHGNNWYSYTKLLSDGLIQLRSKNYLLIRCSHKPNPFPYENAWIDLIGNFDYVDVISNIIINLILSNQNGVFNVGTETKTIYDLAIKTKKVNKNFSPKNAPKNITMDLSKLYKIIK